MTFWLRREDVESRAKSFGMENATGLDKYFFVVKFFIQAVPDFLSVACK